MKLDNVGSYSTIDEYVSAKLKKFAETKRDFKALYDMMFSEKDNIIFEESQGYRIVKTTYRSCEESIRRRAFQLNQQLGKLPAQSLIGLHMQNSREWIEIFWSILMCGYCPLLMNTRLDHECLCGLTETYRVKAVVTDGDESFPVPVVHVKDTAPGEESYEAQDFGEEILLMSSGTSDHVKVCVYSAEEFFYVLKNSYDIICKSAAMKKHYKGQIKQLLFLPLCHIFGLVTVYLWFTFYSRTMVLLKDLMPQTILNTIRRHEVTHIFAVPMLWNRVYDQAIRTIRERGDATWNKFQKGMRISRKLARFPRLYRLFGRVAFKEIRQNIFGDSISFLISGGSEIRTCVLEFMNAIGYHFANGYGMTEIGITSVELSNDVRLLNGGYVGTPFESLEYKIDENGQLLVRGKSMARRIMENGATTRSGSDWFATGDMADCHNGHYLILGRRDDVVISPSGENLNPNLIEEKLDINGVLGACLTALDKDGEKQPVLVINTAPMINAQQLLKLRQDVLARLDELDLRQAVGKLVFVREPLMNPDEIKLNRRRIAQRLAAREFTILEPETLSENQNTALTDHVRSVFAAALGISPEEIADHDDFFADKGGNSLEYFSAVMQLQNTYKIGFPADSGKSLSTVSQMADFIAGAVSDYH